MDEQKSPRQEESTSEVERETKRRLQELEEQIQVLKRIRDIEDPEQRAAMFERFKRGEV